jgi:D-alanyl-D-alanine carboxypeptidase (penicillin-binding protein 5/6)
MRHPFSFGVIFRLVFVCVIVVGLFKFATFLTSKASTVSFLPSSSPHVSLPVYSGAPPPNVSAKNIFIIDRVSKTVLFQKSADDPIYPASTTKMMSAIVVYKHVPLDSIITVQKAYPEGANIHLIPGEKMKVEDLLYAMLIPSANDAAETLANGFPGGREAFINSMNQQATDLHLKHTHFLNPTGLDEDGHFSSAADLARIADYLLSFPYLAKIVSTQNAVIATDDFSAYHSLATVNELLGHVSGVLGVKTGFTDKAGESLVTLIDQIIISLMGSLDRFTDTKLLIDWVYSAYTWPPTQ